MTRLQKLKEKRNAELRREIKRIRDRERNFQKMTPARKRVAIARDVIAQIQAKKLVPESGSWLSVPIDSLEGKVTRETELQEVLAAEQCTACAVGALFACSVMRKDDLPVGGPGVAFEGEYNYHGDEIITEIGSQGFDEASSYMEDIFSNEQLLKIECAFEQGGSRDQVYYDWYYEAKEFGERYSSDRNRMVAIMRNIIDNGGEFVP